MNWLMQFLSSSIGKKLMMAITGFCFCGFLLVHLAGNLTLYGGQAMFNAYVEHLHSLGPLIPLAELGLLALALVHVLTGLSLFLDNRKARPVRYHVSKCAGGRTLASATMPYTGLLLLAFIVLHLLTFRFVDKTTIGDYQIITATFSQTTFAGIYILAMIVAAIHVSHGFWSLFQTLGLNHPKYMPAIKNAGIVLSLLIGMGFGFIPVYIALTT